MRRSGVVVALAVVLLLPQSAGAKTLLAGHVGPGFTITLRNAGGRKVTKLRHGVYAVTVVDDSSIHDFHLKGPGVNKVITSVAFVGTKTVIVTLKAGRYVYLCDPHPSLMHGSFSVY